LCANANELTAEAIFEILRETVFSDRVAPDFSVSGPVYGGSHSLVFRGDGDAFAFPVAIKLARDPSSGAVSPSEARAEYDRLCKVRSVLGESSEQLVPRPVALVESHGLFIAEWIEGTTIGAMCRYWRTPAAALVAAIAQSGTWLRKFHAARTLSPGSVDMTSLLTGLGRYEGTSASSSTKSRGLALLQDLSKTVGQVRVPRSWTHGDYKPDNVIWGANRAVGLDIGGNYENVVLTDVAHFLNHLELDGFHPKAIKARILRRRLSSAFWSGYDPHDGISKLAVRWVRLATMLRLYEARGGVSSGVRARYTCWAFERAIERRIRSLERIARNSK
jgi:hypothetical protein